MLAACDPPALHASKCSCPVLCFFLLHVSQAEVPAATATGHTQQPLSPTQHTHPAPQRGDVGAADLGAALGSHQPLANLLGCAGRPAAGGARPSGAARPGSRQPRRLCGLCAAHAALLGAGPWRPPLISGGGAGAQVGGGSSAAGAAMEGGACSRHARHAAGTKRVPSPGTCWSAVQDNTGRGGAYGVCKQCVAAARAGR